MWDKKFHSEEKRIWREEIANDFTDRDNIFPFTREYRAMLGVYDIAQNEQQLWIMALILCGVTHTPVPRQMVDDAIRLGDEVVHQQTANLLHQVRFFAECRTRARVARVPYECDILVLRHSPLVSARFARTENGHALVGGTCLLLLYRHIVTGALATNDCSSARCGAGRSVQALPE